MDNAREDARDRAGDRRARERGGRGDAHGISRLFREEQDVRQLIMHKNVYEYLEEATDKCQDVANVIESVVVENV